MAYKSEEELKKKSKDYINLLSENDIDADLPYDPFRDHQVKINISKNDKYYGKAILYHSPKKESFKLRCHELNNKDIKPELQSIWSELNSNTKLEGCHIYVDGSYKNGLIGWGYVILQDGNSIEENYGLIDDDSLTDYNQVPGELSATMRSINWCQKNNIDRVTVHYDYKGIKKWATKDWKRKNEMSKSYSNYIDSQSIKIIWKKVKAHSGDIWNERADHLANKGIDQKLTTQYDNNQNDFEKELKTIADKFVSYLNKNNFHAEIKDFYNGNNAQIRLSYEDRDIGIIDIYHTPKNPKNIKFHQLQLKDYKKDLEKSWRKFLNQDKDGKNNRIAKIDYYYNVLRPYREYDFDFIDFAKALQEKLMQNEMETVDMKRYRNDFNTLEQKYKEIKEEA